MTPVQHTVPTPSGQSVPSSDRAPLAKIIALLVIGHGIYLLGYCSVAGIAFTSYLADGWEQVLPLQFAFFFAGGARVPGYPPVAQAQGLPDGHHGRPRLRRRGGRLPRRDVRLHPGSCPAGRRPAAGPGVGRGCRIPPGVLGLRPRRDLSGRWPDALHRRPGGRGAGRGQPFGAGLPAAPEPRRASRLLPGNGGGRNRLPGHAGALGRLYGPLRPRLAPQHAALPAHPLFERRHREPWRDRRHHGGF